MENRLFAVKPEKQDKHAQGREVVWAEGIGILDGVTPGVFITREQAAVMLYRALNYFFDQMIRIIQES